MFGFGRRRRRERLLAEPFPPEWRSIVDRVPVCAALPEDERVRLHGIASVLMAERRFEGCGGLALTEAMKVVVAAQSAVLLLGHDNDFWSDVSSILVYPTTFAEPGGARPIGRWDHRYGPRDGEAWPHGPVILAWDAIERDLAHPETGRNVVLHEFAHRIDMENGDADGVPPLLRRVQPATWQSIMREAYDGLARESKDGVPTVLDEYGATNPAEFFAVATACFFTRPRMLEDRHPSLYSALRAWYRQDPAERPEPAGRSVAGS